MFFIGSVSNGPCLSIRLQQRIFTFYIITITSFLMGLLIICLIIRNGIFEFITRVGLKIKSHIKTVSLYTKQSTEL